MDVEEDTTQSKGSTTEDVSRLPLIVWCNLASAYLGLNTFTGEETDDAKGMHDY